jgi:hypothetical protein
LLRQKLRDAALRGLRDHVAVGGMFDHDIPGDAAIVRSATIRGVEHWRDFAARAAGVAHAVIRVASHDHGPARHA